MLLLLLVRRTLGWLYMVFSVLEFITPMQLKTMTHSESVHLCAELKTGILAVPTDTGSLGTSTDS